MFFKRLMSILNPRDHGAAARAAHSMWLTRAVASRKNYPRIPVRPVSEGGFDRLTSTPAGRILCDGWWYLALDRVDNPPGSDAGAR